MTGAGLCADSAGVRLPMDEKFVRARPRGDDDVSPLHGRYRRGASARVGGQSWTRASWSRPLGMRSTSRTQPGASRSGGWRVTIRTSSTPPRPPRQTAMNCGSMRLGPHQETPDAGIGFALSVIHYEWLPIPFV